MRLCACAALLLALAHAALAQYAYEDGVDFYDDYSLYNAGYDAYQEEEDSFYANEYMGPYDEPYDDFGLEEREDLRADCRIGADGTPQFNGTRPCDVKLEGADKLLKGTPGGLDGVYAVASCENGRPLYKRQGSAAGQERVLWYSAQYRDWDLSNGTAPREDDILMFGGGGGQEMRPQYVLNDWSLATDLMKDFKGTEEYKKIDLTLVCADGSKVEIPAEQRFGKVPLLSDDEFDAQYRRVYERARAKGDASAEVNLGMVTLFVMLGLGCVFGLPFLVARSRRRRNGKPAASSNPINNILDLSRKRGHTQ